MPKQSMEVSARILGMAPIKREGAPIFYSYPNLNMWLETGGDNDAIKEFWMLYEDMKANQKKKPGRKKKDSGF